MKAERFIREYANHKIRILNDMIKNFPQREILNKEDIRKIEKVVELRSHGLITVDEAIMIIAEV